MTRGNFRNNLSLVLDYLFPSPDENSDVDECWSKLPWIVGAISISISLLIAVAAYKGWINN